MMFIDSHMEDRSWQEIFNCKKARKQLKLISLTETMQYLIQARNYYA